MSAAKTLEALADELLALAPDGWWSLRRELAIRRGMLSEEFSVTCVHPVTTEALHTSINTYPVMTTWASFDECLRDAREQFASGHCQCVRCCDARKAALHAQPTLAPGADISDEPTLVLPAPEAAT